LLAHADDTRIVVHPLAEIRDDGSLEPIELMDPAGDPADPVLEIR
jgi:hypothetical protein